MTYPTHTTAWMAAAATALMFTTACGDPEVPVTPYPDGGIDPTPPPPPPPPPDAGPPPVAGPQPCDGTMSAALQTTISAKASAETETGMKPETGFACNTLAEGESFTIPMTLMPGTCYTIVGVSYPNVSELDLAITINAAGGPLPPALAPFLGKPLLAQDGDSGPAATIGRKPSCYHWALFVPVPVFIEAKARTGAGPVAVQLYSKPKK